MKTKIEQCAEEVASLVSEWSPKVVPLYHIKGMVARFIVAEECETNAIQASAKQAEYDHKKAIAIERGKYLSEIQKLTNENKELKAAFETGERNCIEVHNDLREERDQWKAMAEEMAKLLDSFGYIVSRADAEIADETLSKFNQLKDGK